MQHEQTISIKQEEEEEDEASLATTDIVVRSFIKKNMRVRFLSVILKMRQLQLVKDTNKNHR